MKAIKYRRELYQAFKLFGHAVEVGVAEGNYSEEILNWPCWIPTLHMVDRWATTPTQKGDASLPQAWHDANYARVVERMAKYGERAIPMRGESVESSRKFRDLSLAFVYIDADHSYEGVMADLRAWAPKVMEGGVMGFHDYENPSYGVKRAVQEFCAEFKYQPQPIPEDHPWDAGAWFYKETYAHSVRHD